MPATPTSASRPRSVDAVFWCWFVAAVLTAAFGMLIASVSDAVFFRMAGLILVLVGFAQGYLAGRARRGQQRFASAGVGLAMASIALLGVLLVVGALGVLGILIVAVIMVLLITGSVLNQRPASQQWFESLGAA